MDSDVTTGTESDTSDFDRDKWAGYLSGNRFSEYSEDSDDYQGYYNDGRRVPGVYDTSIDNVDESFYDPYQQQKGQKRTHEDENDIKIRHAIAQLNAPTSNNNVGRPLYAIHETSSHASDSVSLDDKSDSNSGTPVHRPVYGRYQKLSNQSDQFSSSSNQDPEDSDSESLETLVLHRLPGENLGMILGIEGGKDNCGKVSSVLVKSVTLGGAAFRATGSSKGVCVSDEILKVNGTDLRTLSHDECISVFKDMPLRVSLGVRRGQKNLPPVEISPKETEVINQKFDFYHSNQATASDRWSNSDSEDDKMSGFAVYKVTIEKEPYETLGLSIVPSYGSTKEYYQIKRILPSGAAAHSGGLQVGDRLITCNGHSLKRLTQNHCLNILKSASSRGNVDLEVIRPVDNGPSMEISVTVNNSNTQIPGLENTQLSRFDNNTSAFDPSQYSLKSQSYDRGNVDVIVTSESEDYLTVSEDEYSRAGRLANISAEEAQKVFTDNSVKLAYQKPFTAIDDVSSETDTLTETETDTDHLDKKPRNLEQNFLEKEVDIVKLDIDSSPYHIPKIVNSVESSEKDRSETKYKSDVDRIPTSDLDNILFSISERQVSHNKISDIDSVNSGLSANQRFIPSSDLDSLESASSSQNTSISPRTSTTNSVRANLNSKAYPYLHSRQQVPESEIDNSCITSGIAGIEFPETLVYIDDNGKLYPEEGYELSDSEKELSQLSENNDQTETALPPPVEFSDSNYQSEITFEINQITNIPVTNIDDFTLDSSSVEVSPSHQQIEIISSQVEYPEAELAKLEASLRDLEEASSDKINCVPNIESVNEDFELIHDSSEPLNYEVTVNNQRVPYRQELSHFSDIQPNKDFEVAETSNIPSDYEVTINNQIVPHRQNSESHLSSDFHDSEEVLQVIKDTEEDKVVITQFTKVEKNYSPVEFFESYYNNNSKMDNTSEAMLKNALDVEYDMIPDSDKYQTRIVLGSGRHSGDAESYDLSSDNQNMVAECLAQEMIKAEQNNYGYYMESVDEPDQIPFEDLPENPPDLPALPPPVMQNLVEEKGCIVTSTPGLNVRLRPSQPFLDKTRSDLNNEKTGKQSLITTTTNKDSNWSFKAKSSENSDVGIEKEIRPTEIEQTSENRVQLILNKMEKNSPSGDSDLIIPTKIDRKPKLPFNISMNNENGEVAAPEPEVIIEPKATVTVSSVKQKMPPDVAPKPSHKVPPVVAPKPSPRKINESKSLGKNVAVVQLTHEDKYSDRTPVNEPIVEPVVMNKDKGVNVLNAIRAVNALAGENMSGKKNITTKEIDISKTANSNIENKEEQQSLPPRQDIIVTDKQIIKKSSQDSEQKKEQTNGETNIDKETKSKFKTQITLTKDTVPKEAFQVGEKKMEETVVNKTSDKSEISEVSISTVPRLNLDSVGSSESGSLSPKSDKSEDSYEKTGVSNQEKTYKISIDAIKMDLAKKDVIPISEVKKLSQIKPLSFNPKSLSVAPPVQYKTTINNLGSKPSGISTQALGRPSLLHTQKAEHPIKRMETMPFEVSILKGILGIGIKTKLTPEGFVQITEILPSGPVGREGNIKVGDYVLSINNTELTGLPDGKVQQILRLLPRGLSKIVASAVPPEQSDTTDVNTTHEKRKVSPRISAPLAALRQPAITASQKSATLPLPRRQVNVTSPKQPLVSTSSIPFASHPFGTKANQNERKEESPATSPRSPKSPTSPKSPRSPKRLTPALSPRRREATSNQPLVRQRSSKVSPRSPEISPRKDDSGKSSPRTPPPVPPRSPEISPRKDDSEKSFPRIPPKSPEVSPRRAESPRTPPPKSPEVSPRVDNSGKLSPQTSPLVSSPEVSPRYSEKSSPRAPPPVAPKPKKYDELSKEKISGLHTERTFEIQSPITHKQDTTGEISGESGPIEIEIFSSITGPKCEHIPSQLIGPSILPGSITYDYVSSKDKSDRIPGKVDVVKNTDPAPVTENKHELEKEAQQHEMAVHVDIVQSTKHAIDNTISTDKLTMSEKEREQDNDIEQTESDITITNEYHFRALEHIDDSDEQDESPKQRSHSVSSESSYTEFNECNVEDESSLEDIVEENDAENTPLHIDKTVESEKEAKSDSSAKGDNLDRQDMKVYKALAENIVAGVILDVKEMNLSESNVKEMNLSEIHSEKHFESSVAINDDIRTKNIEFSRFFLNKNGSPPPLPTRDAPPLPVSPSPVTEIISADDTTFSYCAPVSHNLVKDTTELTQSSQVHAEAPAIVSYKENKAKYVDIKYKGNAYGDIGVYSQKMLGLDTEEQGEYTDDFENESSDNDEYENPESVQTYGLSEMNNDQTEKRANTGKNSIVKDNDTNHTRKTIPTYEIPAIVSQKIVGELQVLNNKDLTSDETESVETKSLTSSDDVLSEGDIVESHTENTLLSQTDMKASKTESDKQDTEPAKVNGFALLKAKWDRKRPKDLKLDISSDKADSSFSSDSAQSPGRSGTPHSDDDKGNESGHHSPEVDRIIRLLGMKQEPRYGKGEIKKVKMDKGVTGLGFVIQGGKGSPKGDLPITIRRIFKGGPADQSGQLQVNDEIIDVNGEDLTCMKHSEAWQHLKFLPSGEICMTIRRFSS